MFRNDAQTFPYYNTYICIVLYYIHAFVRSDPGPRTELMTRGLSYKSVLAVVQLLLALIGSFLVIYVPLSTNCGNDSLAIMATIMVSGYYCLFFLRKSRWQG